MPIPAPEAWENSIPPYGIRAAKPTAQALKIPIALDRIARDVSTALEEFGLPPVVSSHSIVAASAAARDAHWGVPANAAERLALQSLGATTLRTDTGTEERYFASLTDGGANPGGRPVAGWEEVGASSTAPFAQAAGEVSLPTVGVDAGVTVAASFPVGLFTRPPIMMLSTSSARLIARADPVSTSGFTFGAYNWTPGVAGAPTKGYWVAIQMSEDSAAS